ncbi:MAG: ATP-binding cassette domain-containing protein [Thermoplasmataceae archaeon]
MVEIVNATVRYNKMSKKAALDAVNFTSGGEKAVIIGPNGSGKTTILRLLLGLAISETGTVKVFGQSVNRIKNETRVSTNLSDVYRIMRCTVLDTFKIYAKMKGGNMEEPIDMIRKFGLQGILGNKLYELSTGQQKMVCNILAFSFSPSIILLDEPFDNVDQGSRIKLLEIIGNYKGDIILNTHEFDFLNRLKGWSMYFMIEGKIFGKFNSDQLRDLYLNKGEIAGNLGVIETSFGKFCITENYGSVPISTSRNLNSMFDEVA